MCVAIPSRVTGLDGAFATVECFGVAREVSLALMSEPLAVGDYVLVRSGHYVVERIDRNSALDVLDVMGRLLRESEAEVATEQRLGLAAAAG